MILIAIHRGALRTTHISICPMISFLPQGLLGWARAGRCLVPVNPLLNQALTFGLPCSSLLSPGLARILLCQFSENHTSLISEQILYPLHSVSYHPGLPLAKILSSWFRQSPPYPLSFFLVIFHQMTPFLGCKSPLALVVFGVEPNLAPLL